MFQKGHFDLLICDAQIVLGCAVGWASRLLLGHGVVAGVGLGRPGARLAQALQARADLELSLIHI